MTLTIKNDGEFKGWQFWDDDDFESKTVGPFYFRTADDGNIVGAFRAEARHMNGHGNMHGGCIMTFADFALFAMSEHVRDDRPCVTMTLNSEFMGAASIGDLMEARGDILRDGGSVMFLRGVITANGKPCLNFSGTIKKLRKSV
jgi:uncharacterized protein (TIGR00369 family)